jgi:hypothetical protein
MVSSSQSAVAPMASAALQMPSPLLSLRSVAPEPQVPNGTVVG